MSRFLYNLKWHKRKKWVLNTNDRKIKRNERICKACEILHKYDGFILPKKYFNKELGICERCAFIHRKSSVIKWDKERNTWIDYREYIEKYGELK